jgi:hypothetical protein
MYCSLGQNQFFDDAGAPLSAGRVKIYAKGSDTLLPIYEDSGDGFVPAQNPVITANDGRIPTIFWPEALVDVVVEKSNGDGTYTELDSYVAGLDLASVEAVQGVGSITELRSIMPSENMVVQVNGYYTAGDSPTRKYLWVAGAANTDDGGYIIASNVNAGGRWLMLWDDSEFLPVSLYGVMCGYSGYAKTSNIPALESLGHYVIVGSVRVEVPPVILFDWRMAQPTSGQSSPVAYYWSGIFTTTHYVACARGVTFSISTPPTIHCAGVRGESYANAYWLVDQDYTTKDPAEKISTLMFNGNTQAMHDAFMACSACSKVKVLELFDGALYPILTSQDLFANKIIYDHAAGGWPVYGYSSSVVILNDSITVGNGLKAGFLYSLNFMSCEGNITANGDISSQSNMSASGNGIFGHVISQNFSFDGNSVAFSKESNRGGMLVPKGIQLENSPINLGNNFQAQTSRMFYEFAPSSGNEQSVNLRTDTSGTFVNSNYRLHDVVTITNSGEGTVRVTYAGNAGNVVLLNQWDACSFVKLASGAWAKMSPA